ncbi:MAG: sensor domain-containing diguanylate cyclase [Campylobacterales bacterium]|nr:sensor domain-containing diguanylate cyclase [Campylobacterales bacterium]
MKLCDIKKKCAFSTKGKICSIISLFVLISFILASIIYFQSEIMDGFRIYTRGEGLWAKSQKNAVLYLERYSYTRAESDYRAFQKALEVSIGDRRGRQALEENPPNRQRAKQGFLQGQNDPDDIDTLLWFFLKFKNISYMEDALKIWTLADEKIAQLTLLGEEIHSIITVNKEGEEQRAVLREQLHTLNGEFLDLDKNFSTIIGEAGRSVKKGILILTLVTSVFFMGIGILISRRILSTIETSEFNLKMSESRYRTLFESTYDGILITDASLKIIAVNKALCRLTGYEEEELKTKTPTIFQSGTHDPMMYREMWNSLNSEGHFEGDILDRTKDGSLLPLRISIDTIKNSDNEITHFIAIYNDITKRKNHEEHLNFLAHHDALTGLPNRVLFDDRILQLIKRAERTETKFAIVFLDLDKFKPVNDQFGHKTGDKLLRMVAKRLTEHARDIDTVTRLGGDEFVILFEDIQDRAMVETIVENILMAIAAPYLIEGDTIQIGASAGISIYPENGLDSNSLLHYADGEMYRMKNRGRHLE